MQSNINAAKIVVFLDFWRRFSTFANAYFLEM